MKTDQGLLDPPKESSQIRERIWSILEVLQQRVSSAYVLQGERYTLQFVWRVEPPGGVVMSVLKVTKYRKLRGRYFAR